MYGASFFVMFVGMCLMIGSFVIGIVSLDRYKNTTPGMLAKSLVFPLGLLFGGLGTVVGSYAMDDRPQFERLYVKCVRRTNAPNATDFCLDVAKKRIDYQLKYNTDNQENK